MPDDVPTICIQVVIKGREQWNAGLHTLPPILDADGVSSDVDVPRGIPPAIIAKDIKEWLDPMLKG